MKRAGMDRQLALLDGPPRVWRLDDETRQRGRRGVADARLALERAAARQTARRRAA
jgi:hypothetical protein